MNEHKKLNRLFVILLSLGLLIIGSFGILATNFQTPATVNEFFQNSNTYYYLSEIIKSDIRSKYPKNLTGNILQLGIAETFINAVITPSLVEMAAKPLINLSSKIAKQPTSIVNNNLVINTQKYKQQASQTLSSFNLPPPIASVGANLITSVPDSIILVNVKTHPNSILVAITRARIFIDHVRTITTVAWYDLIIFGLLLIWINIRNFKRFFGSFTWIFGSAGIFLLICSFIIPASFTSFGPHYTDPVTGSLEDSMFQSMISYLFSLARNFSLIYLAVAAVSYLIYRFTPFAKAQTWSDEHIFPSHEKEVQPAVRKKKRST